jgi:DNA-binding transcriptional ArsR family regulator
MRYYLRMDMFTALAEPTRRDILVLLGTHGQLSAGEIYTKFTSSPPAISQHLKVLRDAELVTVEKHAQQRLSEIEKWLKALTKQWEERFSRLDAVVEREKRKLKGY